MRLTLDQQRRSQKLFSFLRKQSSEYFIETGIRKCDLCGGTGLSGLNKCETSYTWDTYSFCDECHGVGYRGLSGAMQIDNIHYLCKHCEGVGCNLCIDGIVDWVTHAMG